LRALRRFEEAPLQLYQLAGPTSPPRHHAGDSDLPSLSWPCRRDVIVSFNTFAIVDADALLVEIVDADALLVEIVDADALLVEIVDQ
jgi:hypothetical protein